MTDPRTPGMDDLADAAAAAERADAGLPMDIDDPEHALVAEPADDPLAAALRDVEEQKDKYLRLFAEFDNFRRRVVREKQEAEHRGMANLLRGTLDVLDDIARFAHIAPASTDAGTIVEGVLMVEKKLLKSLAGHGLEVVNPEGHPFDPTVHEAISTAPAASPEEDHLVAQVFQVGYVFNGTLLRPARVVVKQWNG